jgi:HEAT repeat protein
MTRSTIFAATAAGGMLLTAATLALTPDVRPTRLQAPTPADERAAVAAVLTAARGSGPLMCALAARAIDQSFHWGDFRPGYDPRDLEARPVRETVRITLDVLHDPGLVEPLRAALSDSDDCVRRLAAPLLGRVRHPQALQALRTALRDAGAATREAAALGLGFAGDSRAMPDLITTLRDGAADVRVAAAWALGQIESRGSVRPLVGALDDGDARVRATAAWALGRIEDPEAVAVLARALRRDQDVDVRRNAAWALGKVN